MRDEAWPAERVEAAYREWKALEDHAVRVATEMMSARGEDSWFYRLCLPSWCGTGWPGKEFVLEGEDAEYPSRFPMEWLSTYPACVDEAKRKHAEWQATAEAKDAEQADRDLYRKLKAKFETPEAPMP